MPYRIHLHQYFLKNNNSVMSDNIIQKFRDKFFEEANMLLDKFEKDILELEKIPGDNELLESVFRAMHTVKGISAMYGFEYISEFTHFLENIFQNMRDGKISFSKEISEISLASIDHIHNLLNDEKLLNPELKIIHNDLLAHVNRIANVTVSEVSPEPALVKQENSTSSTWYIIINTNEHMYFRGINLQGICRELSALGEYTIEKISDLCNENSDSWGIMLVTSVPEDELRDVFMFIEDDCRIFRMADRDIITSVPAQFSEIGGPSIIDLIEGNNLKKSIIDVAPAGNENEIEKQNNLRQQSKRISVDTDKLDNLMYLVSQLITLNSQLNVANRESDYLKQRDYIEMLDSLSKQFRNNALEIRLVPLSDIALRFQRLIRDLSKGMGKKIDFVTEGTDTELDKNTIDSIVEPLMHIIRNCIDHGIEEPLTRKNLGKSETGTIKLTASYSGTYIMIKIQDDGAGIDVEKVRKKAIERGILKKEDNPSVQELYDIIFLPGFSTAQSVSEVSGRGVGMDIVRTKISDLRGTVTLDSKFGEGTTFMIKLSQSMAITDTLLFKVQESYFILPISEIESCDQVNALILKERQHTSTIPYNDELIPFVDLRKYLRLQGEYDEHAKSIMVRNGDHTVAIIADKIIGEHQAVLKPLNKTYSSESIISSVSQLGDGKLAFLIDTGVLNKQIGL
jgi:two-component system, chemotaxis family, sensor kinase CheA